MFAGIALGSYVFIHLVNRPYTIMFAINATLLLLAIVYSLVWLKWQTSSRQQSFTGTNWLLDFFDVKHVATTVRTLVKSRRNHGKLHLWLLLLAMCLYTFQRDEKPKSQMYTSLIFNWNVVDFSNFKTFQSALFVVGQLPKSDLTQISQVNISRFSTILIRNVFLAIQVKGENFYRNRENFHFRLIYDLDYQ